MNTKSKQSRSLSFAKGALALLMVLACLVSAISVFSTQSMAKTSEVLKVSNPNHIDLNVDPEKEDVVYLSKIDHKLSEGKTLGTISSTKLGINCKLCYGTSDDTLWKGGGLHTNSSLPGFATPGLVAGHARVCFKGFAQAKLGDVITIKMPYGTYKYRISQIKIIRASDYVFEMDLSKITDQFIFYACYPYPKTSYEKYNRIFYYCDRISGPKVIDDSVGGSHKWAVRPGSGNLRDISNKYKYPSTSSSKK